MHIERVSVDDLLLWDHNPRVEYSNNQLDELSNIYNSSNIRELTSHRQLMNLAVSIAENGYQNEVEPVLVLKADSRYVVQDANRRLSAIKLLRSPDKYKRILDKKDYHRLVNLSRDFPDNIPDQLDVVVFGEEEKDKLKEILARKHNGPLDGVGTLPWSTEAKDRFTRNSKNLADKLTGPFEKQFGESLVSYLGGSNAITSTRRVFGFRKVRDYLNIQDVNSITPKELDKVKEFVDELKEYNLQSGILYSRMNSKDIEQNVLIPLKDKHFRSENNLSEMTPKIAMMRTAADFLATFSTSTALHLGARYNKERWINFNDDNFESVNLILVGLGAYGVLEGSEGHRWAKAYLMAPVIRVIYELSLQALNNSHLDDFDLPCQNVSSNHKDNVDYAVSKMLSTNTNRFETYLSNSHILFETYNEAHSVINSIDFGASVTDAQLLSHKSAKDYPIDTIMRLFDEAVLFALLSEQYVVFVNDSNMNTNNH